MLCAALEKDVRSFSEGFHELPWHHGFPQRYFKLWNLSHDAVGARPDRQDASGAVCRAALQRCQVRLWRWMLMAGRFRSDAARQPGAAGLTQLYFSAGVGFPYVLRVFAQEIVPRPDSGSAFVCKSHVRLCVASPVPKLRSFLSVATSAKWLQSQMMKRELLWLELRQTCSMFFRKLELSSTRSTAFVRLIKLFGGFRPSLILVPRPVQRLPPGGGSGGSTLGVG